MTTRASMEDFIYRAEQAVDYANEQLETWKKQEHFNHTEYTKAAGQLEHIYNDLEHLQQFSNSQQKERIARMQQLVRQTQNDLVLDENDLGTRSFIEHE